MNNKDMIAGKRNRKNREENRGEKQIIRISLIISIVGIIGLLLIKPQEELIEKQITIKSFSQKQGYALIRFDETLTRTAYFKGNCSLKKGQKIELIGEQEGELFIVKEIKVLELRN